MQRRKIPRGLAAVPNTKHLPPEMVAGQRPLPVTLGDCDRLMMLIQYRHPHHPLLRAIRYVKRLLEDRARQVREMEKTAQAEEYWHHPLDCVDRLIGKIKDGRRKHHRKLESMIPCETTETVKATLPGMLKKHGIGKEKINHKRKVGD